MKKNGALVTPPKGIDFAAWQDGHYEDLSFRYLNRAIDTLLTSRPLLADLYGGFTGVAWVAEHLLARFAATSEHDAEESIDEALCELLRMVPWPGHYDLLTGLVGYGIYAIERLPRPCATECLALVVDRLAEAAVHGETGISWRWKPELMKGIPKEGKHEALADVYESIGELKYYRETFIRA